MARIKTPYAARIVRHQRLRQHLGGTAERPRLNVFRSGRYTYAQVVDDELGQTLAAASSRELAAGGFAKTGAAGEVGKIIAQRAKAKGGKKVVFDSENMTITNVADANKHLYREYREGWKL